MDAYASALKAYLESPERSQGALAEAIGTSQPSIHRYATGERFPEKAVAEKIALATGDEVPLSLWQRVAMERLGIENGEDAAAEAA